MFTHFNRNITKLNLIPGAGGIFEVSLNGELIYSKKDTGIFPQTEEIIELIEAN